MIAEETPAVDEFARAGLPLAEAESVAAPFVANCPAVMECRLAQEVPLPGTASTLLIGEVLRVRLSDELAPVDGTWFVDHDRLRPLARLWGDHYALIGETLTLPRPVV